MQSIITHISSKIYVSVEMLEESEFPVIHICAFLCRHRSCISNVGMRVSRGCKGKRLPASPRLTSVFMTTLNGNCVKWKKAWIQLLDGWSKRCRKIHP